MGKRDFGGPGGQLGFWKVVGLAVVLGLLFAVCLGVVDRWVVTS
jgi:hypothetical protein